MQNVSSQTYTLNIEPFTANVNTHKKVLDEQTLFTNDMKEKVK